MDVKSQKCPGCGATLKWNATTESWICEYCGHEATLEEIKKGQELEKTSNVGTAQSYGTVKSVDELGREKVIYSCPNCGAELMAEENTTATKCVYCKSTTVIKDKMQGEFLPDEVIPFSKTKQDAINGFKSCLKGKWFAPRAFSNPKNINEIAGVYVPFWLYNCDCDADVDFDGKKITSWRSGDYQYTKTDTYSVKRIGNMKFERVPVDGSEKAEDALMDSIEPFNYDNLREYNDAFLSGFLAEKYDVDKEKAAERMQYRVENTAIDVLKSTTEYDSISVKAKNVDIKQTDVKYVMLPVWMLNIKYKNKMYKFAMNGETGKMIGEIPKSTGKVIGLTLLVWAIITIVLGLIFTIPMILGVM